MWKNLPLLTLIFSCLNLSLSAQNADNAKPVTSVSGAINITNNGISLIPTFSLGKPAAVFNLSIGKSNFSFDQELAFSLEGKPWYFLFWLRYKWHVNEKFRVYMGTHLGLNFKTVILPTVTDSTESKVTDRYVVGELFPNYSITKNINVGVYYLYARGIDVGTKRNTNFLTLNVSFSKLKIPGKFLLTINPQVYYLNQDGNDGYYFTSAVTLGRLNFPLSVTSVINKVITTKIESKDFVWNVILTYSFGSR